MFARRCGHMRASRAGGKREGCHWPAKKGKQKKEPWPREGSMARGHRLPGGGDGGDRRLPGTTLKASRVCVGTWRGATRFGASTWRRQGAAPRCGEGRSSAGRVQGLACQDGVAGAVERVQPELVALHLPLLPGMEA